VKLAPKRLLVAQTSVCAFVAHPADFRARRPNPASRSRLVRVSSPRYFRDPLFICPEPCGRTSVTPTESYSFARIARKPNRILLFHRPPGGTPYLTSYYSQPFPSRPVCPQPTQKGSLMPRKHAVGPYPSLRSGESSDSHPDPASPPPATIPQTLPQSGQQLSRHAIAPAQRTFPAPVRPLWHWRGVLLGGVAGELIGPFW